MNMNWYTFAIYLDGVRRYESCQADALSVPEMIERLQFVHDEIEYCFAEGRLIDHAIFDALEDAADRIYRADYPTVEEARTLAKRLAERYGVNKEASITETWIKTQQNGESVIWIDQSKIITDSNRRLFGSPS